jgi:hypothetical protein
VSDEAREQSVPVRPLLRVVRGKPTAEELAALVAVLASRGGSETAPEPPRSPWGRPGAAIRYPLSTHVGAWRASGLVRGVRTRADW